MPMIELSIPYLRRQLDRLDDPEIDTLCLDHFPDIYDKFGRGMRRDEKINLLLDHCRRRATECARLADILSDQSVASETTVQASGSEMLNDTMRGPASAAQSPTLSARPKSPPAPIRQRWALLVGINQYVDPSFPPLKFCVSDVLALQQMLTTLGYTVVALHDQAGEEHLRPTRTNIEEELARLCQVAQADDLLYVHFACHGQLAGQQPLLLRRLAHSRLRKRHSPLPRWSRECARAKHSGLS